MASAGFWHRAPFDVNIAGQSPLVLQDPNTAQRPVVKFLGKLAHSELAGHVTGGHAASSDGAPSQRPLAEHSWHTPSHALSQHTPSTQKPDVHSATDSQVAPKALEPPRLCPAPPSDSVLPFTGKLPVSFAVGSAAAVPVVKSRFFPEQPASQSAATRTALLLNQTVGDSRLAARQMFMICPSPHSNNCTATGHGISRKLESPQWHPNSLMQVGLLRARRLSISTQDQWFCAELFIDNAEQAATLWIGGEEAASIVNGQGGWPVQPASPALFLGSMGLQGGQTGVFIDDVAAGPTRIGCE